MNYRTTLRATNYQPHWNMEQTISMLGTYYMKLTIIEEMHKLYDRGFRDDDIILARSSLELTTSFNDLNKSKQINIEHESFVILEEKSIDPDSFWKTFHRLKRPAVLYKINNEYKFLYTQEHALRFEQIETNSPQLYKLISKGVALLWLLDIVGTHYAEVILNNIDKTVISAIENNNQIYTNPHERLIVDGSINHSLNHDLDVRDVERNSYLESEYRQSLLQKIEDMKSHIDRLENTLAIQNTVASEEKLLIIREQRILINQQARVINILQDIKSTVDERENIENELLPFLKRERNIELKKLQKRLDSLPLLVDDFVVV